MIVSVVPLGAAGMSVKNYLSRAYPLIPAFALREALKKRDVKINGFRVGAEDILKAGDEIYLYIAEKYAPVPLEMVFEDDDILVFVKPCGLPVDADAEGIEGDTALKRLKMKYDDARLVHRLDAGTGGIMLAARHAGAEKMLTKAFGAHKIEKHYAALALGRMPKKQDTLRDYLEKDASNAKVRVRAKATPEGKPIETHYEVRREFSARGITLSELDVVIPTGRTHQIRAHLAFIDHPLLGDDKYGNREANRKTGVREPCLWCRSLKIVGAEGLEKYEGMRFQAACPDWKLEE